MKEPIRKIELKDGTVRYRLVVDIGLDDNGKRQQLTRTFDKSIRASLRVAGSDALYCYSTRSYARRRTPLRMKTLPIQVHAVPSSCV